MRRPSLILAAAGLVLALAAPPARAQGTPTPAAAPAVDAGAFKVGDPGLSVSADLAYVLTAGNARASSLGFKGELQRTWTQHAVKLAVSGIRASSSANLHYATGTPASYEVVRPDPEPTVEYYGIRSRYDYRLTERRFLLAGANWERNYYSGIESRFVGEAGFGYAFAVGEPTDFRATLGVTYTNNQEVNPNPDLQDNFAGARLSYSLVRKLTSNTRLTHDLVLDENLQQTDDFRADGSLGVAVAMNSRLALRTSVRVLYRNLPALEALPLRAPGGVDTGVKVYEPYEKVDTGFSVSVVFNHARKDAK